jgi:transposase-like protein
MARRATGSVRRKFAGMEQHRLHATELCEQGATKAEVARAPGVSHQSTHDWYMRWRAGRVDTLRAAGRAGTCPAARRHTVRIHSRINV